MEAGIGIKDLSIAFFLDKLGTPRAAIKALGRIRFSAFAAFYGYVHQGVPTDSLLYGKLRLE
jgi:hypothetical protein